MSSEWVLYFTCEGRGLECPSPEVPYDQLGYVVCPGCGTETRPTAVAMADVSTPADG